jgi:hypothetical protein
MSQVHCFTSASLASLDRARVLGRTLRRYEPTWTTWLCLVDEPPSCFDFDRTNEPFNHVNDVDEIGLPNPRYWTFAYEEMELRPIVNCAMLSLLLSSGADKVVQLDASTALFDTLRAVDALLDDHSIVLSPRILEPEQSRTGLPTHEIGALSNGVVDPHFFAVANTHDGRRFAGWWRSRLLEQIRSPNHRLAEERWLDLVSALFATTCLLRDPGCNASLDNLFQREISTDRAGSLTVDRLPLRCFRFSADIHAPDEALEIASPGSIVAYELIKWYRIQLKANAVAGLPQGWRAYGRYEDGSPIPRPHRIAYRTRPALRELFPNPFAAGSNSLKAYLEKDAASAADAASASVETEV